MDSAYFFIRRLSLAVAVSLTALFVSPAGAQKGPLIERIEPTAGPPGSFVQIIGRRFEQGAKVKIDRVDLMLERVTPYRITARIPESATTGRISIDCGSVRVVGPEFRVIEPPSAPKIVRIFPQQGPPGSEVSIVGHNFSPWPAQNLASLGTHPVVVRFASPLELRIVVPETAESGRLRVEVVNAGTAESQAFFTVTAATAISGFEPRVGGPGTRVAITGQGFKRRIEDNRVYLNNQPVKVVSAREDGLIVEIPKRASTGPFLVDVRGAGRSYSKEAFAVQYRPTIVGFTPVEGSSGTSLTIRGTNFGTDPSNVEVHLGAVPVQVVKADKTELVVEVPPGAESGRVSVLAHRVGPAVSEDLFNVLQPLRIDRFNPNSGPAETIVTIEGSGFSSILENNVVRLGARALKVLAAAPTRLQVRVSAGASSVFTVSVRGGGSIRTTDPFVVTVPPRIASFEPQGGGVGSDITVRGSGFGTNASVLRASLGDKQMEVRSVRDDIAVVRVPAAARSGPIRFTVPLQGTSVSETDFRVVSSSETEEKE
ncbi:MAG: IPT/TIG domain-containing protein [Deltaproteobacteria bacterium]|nr:IPT/TIG domain-containing protein [Deltaproteobacteria bacterium]